MVTVVISFSDSLVCSDTLVLSPSVSVEVIDPDDNICVFAPNPVFDESKLIFSNENQEEVTISIVNEKGALVFETTTKDESISINANRFKKGVYYFDVKSEGAMGDCRGKFVVM